MKEFSSHDLIAMGRVGVDIYPLQVGVKLEDVDEFGKFLGGSATNVAVAAAQHGRHAAVITGTGNDPFGRFIHRTLRELGVSDSFVKTVDHLPTPVTFCEMFPPDDFPLYFYRLPKAPDLEIHPQDLDLAAIADAKVFWATVTGLSAEPSRAAHQVAFKRRNGRAHTVLDLDYRPMFWESSDAAREQITKLLPYVSVVLGNTDECRVAVGESDPHAAARALLDHGVQLAIVKRGPDGVLACTADQVVEVPPHVVKVLNGLGAGDGFGGALCHGLLANWSLERILQFANIAGAIVASRLECSTAMPSSDEVMQQMVTVDD